MKTRLLFALMALMSLAVRGQNYGNMLGVADESKRPSGRKVEEQNPIRKTVLLATQYPLRRVDGELFDLTPFFQSLTDPGKNSLPTDWTLIHGTILQIVDNGALVQTEPLKFWDTERRVVYVKNLPLLKAKADGDPVTAFTRLSGTYRYRSFSGAVSAYRTVRAYDFGVPEEGQSPKRFTLAEPERRGPVDRSVEAARAMDEGMRRRKEAAQNGDGRAQYYLGLAFLRGDGVATNLGMAKFWLKRAATNGYPQALDQLQKIPPTAPRNYDFETNTTAIVEPK